MDPMSADNFGDHSLSLSRRTMNVFVELLCHSGVIY